MRKPKNYPKTKIRVNNSYVGETIEEALRRITEEKAPIKSEFPMVYTDRKDGVLPGYDIRTDRFEVAREAKEKLGKLAAQKAAKREDMPKTDEAGTEDKNNAE